MAPSSASFSLLLRAGGPLALTGLAACEQGPQGPQETYESACTAIGCDNGVRLRVFDSNGAPLEQFRGIARFEGSVEGAFACPLTDDAPPSTSRIYGWCLDNIVDVRHANYIIGISIESDLAAEAVELDLRPLLVESRPNGEDCEATCKTASMDVTLLARTP